MLLVSSHHRQGCFRISQAMQRNKKWAHCGNQVPQEEINDKKKSAEPSARLEKYTCRWLRMDCQITVFFSRPNIFIFSDGVFSRRRPHDFANIEKRDNRKLS